MEYWINWPWGEMMMAGTFIWGAVTAIFLLVNKYPSSRYLGILIGSNLFLAVSVAVRTAYSIMWLAIVFAVVVFFIYSKAFFIQYTRVNSKHLIPIVGVAVISFFSPINQFQLPFRIAITLLILSYLVAAIGNIGKEGHSRGISWFQNPGSRLAWFRNFMVLNVLIILFWLVAYDWLLIEYVMICIALQLSFVYAQLIRESAFLAPIQLGNKYQKSTLTADQKHAILGKLDVLLKNEKFYLDDSISLSHVAKQLHTTTHHLSQVINESKGITFQKLISQYRIQEAKLLLKDKQYEQTTIENIAAMVGYNSKSAFNTTFKKLTGYTPTDYRAQDDVRSYREERLPGREKRFFWNLFVSSYHVLSLNRMNMVTNFLKIFSRTLAKNKVFSSINLFGLTVGFCCCILIYLFISDELSYDRELPNSDHIYRIAWINDNPQTRTPHPMALAMAQDMPEVEMATSISPWYGSGLNLQTVKVKNDKNDILFEEPDFFFADSTFFDIFQLEIVAGDKDALKKPWNLVITEKMAAKYFGEEDPIGQQLLVEENPLNVAAVVNGMPENSHFHFRGLLSYVSLKTINPNNPWFTWADFGHFNYIKIRPNNDHKLLESKIPEWVVPYLD